MGNASQVAAEMEMFAFKKWTQTELYVRQFSNSAEDLSRAMSPGPDTGTLDASIKYEEKSLGVFLLEVTSEIEGNTNPDTGESAAVYGDAWERGHYNVFLKQSIPPLLFMDEGGRQCYADLMGKLSGIWSGI